MRPWLKTAWLLHYVLIYEFVSVSQFSRARSDPLARFLLILLPLLFARGYFW
jgi:hypothetical protein